MVSLRLKLSATGRGNTQRPDVSTKLIAPHLVRWGACAEPSRTPQPFGANKPKAMTPSVHIKSSGLHASRTCEGSQFDAAGHVVVKVDPPAFVVALDDGVHSRGADAVA